MPRAISPLLLLAWTITAAAAELPAELKVMHDEMLYPAVRVSTGNVGGSGTILYSEDRGDGCQSYVLTNHHVIADAVKVKEDWSSLLQADVKREFNEEVQVEVFRYARGSRQDVCDSYRAEIVAHDRRHDLALLRLKSERKLDYVAKLLPADGLVTIFEPIWAVGCSLGHPPLQTTGTLNYLDDVIDRKLYWMGSAQIIYGNSGGSVFVSRDGHYWFVGVPSRVSLAGFQAITHMGYFVPITRLRQWIEDEHLDFLVDAEQKPSDCFAEREDLRKQAEVQIYKQLGEKKEKK